MADLAFALTQFAGQPVSVLLAAGMILSNWVAAMSYTLFAFGHERSISLDDAKLRLSQVPTAYVELWQRADVSVEYYAPRGTDKAV